MTFMSTKMKKTFEEKSFQLFLVHENEPQKAPKPNENKI